MTEFDSILVIETEAGVKKDFRLPHTSRIVFVDSVSVVQNVPFPRLLYIYNNGFRIHQLNPFKCIGELEFCGHVEDAVMIEKRMLILSNDTVTTLDRKASWKVAKKFDGTRLSNIERNVGVQGPDKLFIYSLEEAKLLQEHECTTHYSIRDLLITAYDYQISFFRRGNKILDVSMPDMINRVCTDPLFTNVYCGGSSGDVFCLNTSRGEPVVMSYHKSKVTCLDVSFCGKYLYSADLDGTVCIWSTESNTVIGKISLGTQVKRIHVTYVPE